MEINTQLVKTEIHFCPKDQNNSIRKKKNNNNNYTITQAVKTCYTSRFVISERQLGCNLSWIHAVLRLIQME